MANHVMARSRSVVDLLNHPSRAALRQAIREHAGPWTEGDVARLNAEGFGVLVFEQVDGRLHVHRVAE